MNKKMQLLFISIILLHAFYSVLYCFDEFNLGIIKKDQQVNENAGRSYHEDPKIATADNGLTVIVWVDSRNGNKDIYGQLFDNLGKRINDEFKINDDTSNKNQYLPSIGMNSNGDFIVAWKDGRDGGFMRDKIYVQRYNKNGEKIGVNINVNNELWSDYQYCPPVVDLDAKGNFIVAWSVYQGSCLVAQLFDFSGNKIGNYFNILGENGRSALFPSLDVCISQNGEFVLTWRDERHGISSIYAHFYDSTGTAVSKEFIVNDSPFLFDSFEAIAEVSIDMNDNGIIVISWSDFRETTPNIYYQQYDKNANAIGKNCIVNENNISQMHPSTSVSNSGNFVITWIESQNNGYNIFGQFYDKERNKINTKFQVNSVHGSASRFDFPSVGIDSTKNFIITWHDNREGEDIFVQFYDNKGIKINDNLLVNLDEGASDQTKPQIACDKNGNFVVVWEDFRNQNYDIYGQRYDFTGKPIGKNFKINDDTEKAKQLDPQVSMDDMGNFVVVWQDFRKSLPNIFMQRYDFNGLTVGSNIHLYPGHYQEFPTVAMNSYGDFVVAWIYMNTRASCFDAKMLIFNKTGNIIKELWAVNEKEWSVSWDVSVGLNNNGKTIAAWNSGNKFVIGQIFDFEGNKLGEKFLVSHSDSSYRIDDVSIGTNFEENFVISWAAHNLEKHEPWTVYAKQYNFNGTPVSDILRVNDFDSETFQGKPSCSMNSDGNFIISWKDLRKNITDIYAQVYNIEGQKISPNFKINLIPEISDQEYPFSILNNEKIITVWQDNRIESQGWDIFFNILSIGSNSSKINQLKNSKHESNFDLHQNYPNPFNSITKIKYNLSTPDKIKLKIYNISGQEVETLVDEYQEAGEYEYNWKTLGLPSGIYFYKLIVGKSSIIKKLVLQR